MHYFYFWRFFFLLSPAREPSFLLHWRYGRSLQVVMGKWELIISPSGR